jgi:hypothetical protein
MTDENENSHELRKKLMDMTDEGLGVHDSTMRLLLADVMEAGYLSTDVRSADEATKVFVTAHSVFHEYLASFREVAIPFLIKSGEIREATAAITLVEALEEVHTAVEWFELMIVDNLHRLKAPADKSEES